MSLGPSPVSFLRPSLPWLARLGLVWLVAAGCAAPPTAPPPEPADTVFYGSHILTMDPETRDAEAVALRGDSIVAVGLRSELESYVGEATRVVELGDRALLPGFIDTHGHLALVMQTLDMLNASSPPVGPMESIEDIVGAIEARIVARGIAPGDFVMGYGYDDSLLAEGRHPDRDDLDRASLDHPIVLLHVSGHLATANSAALALFGFDASTEDPPGGVIRRRPGTKEPNGVLEETAAHVGLGRLLGGQQPDPAAFARQVFDAIAYHAAFGITTIQDGASSPAMAQGLRGLAAAQPLPVDVALFPVGSEMTDETPIESFGFTPDYTNGVRVAGVKFVLDGSPQGRTAWLTEPYVEGPSGAPADYVAYPITDPDHYRHHVDRLLDAGIPILAHANGDAAIDLMIEGVDLALAGEMKDHRSVTIHAQLTRPDQLEEMKRLGIVPSFFAAHPYFWGDWHRRSFGDERAMRISPLASAVELELPFTIHNDAPVVPPHILRLVEVAVGRKTRAGVVLGEAERIGVEEALHAVTLGAAYQYFEEDRKGSISVGKQADLVVLGRDPREVPVDEISEIEVVETIARGRTVHPPTPTESMAASGAGAR